MLRLSLLVDESLLVCDVLERSVNLTSLSLHTVCTDHFISVIRDYRMLDLYVRNHRRIVLEVQFLLTISKQRKSDNKQRLGEKASRNVI